MLGNRGAKANHNIQQVRREKVKEKILKVLRYCSIKDVAILSSGVFLAQLVGFLCQPIATRLYSPEDFGTLNLIISLVAMFSPILTLQYEFCIVTAKTDREANITTALSFYICFIIVAIFGIGIVIYDYINPKTFASAGLWLYTSIPIMLFTGTATIVTNYNNRFGQYKLIAKISLYRAIISNIIKLGLGYLNFNFSGLILSNMSSTIFGIKRQAKYLLENKKEIMSVKLWELKESFIKNINQPLFSTPGIFVFAYAFSIIPFFINSLYGMQEVGFYSLASSMFALPMSLVSINIGKVFFRNASQEQAQKGNFFNSYRSVVGLTSVLSIIPFVILFFIAEPVFKLVFGDIWVRCGTFAKYLIPMYAVNFVANTVISGLIICGGQKEKFLLQSFFLVFSLITYYIVKVFSLPIEIFLMLISITYAINYIGLLILIYYKSKGEKCESR